MPSRGPPHCNIFYGNSPTPDFPPGTFSIGLELELVLRKPDILGFYSRPVFCDDVVMRYISYLQSHEAAEQPKMHNMTRANTISAAYFETWSLLDDPTLLDPESPPGPKNAWAVEITSPILRVHRSTKWREQIQFLWHFLTGEYKVMTNATCGTHIHLSINGGYSLDQLRRVSRSVIHFEPAFEALLPQERRAHRHARSNWLDHPNFGARGLTRLQMVQAIDNAATIHDLIDVISPQKHFGWALTRLEGGPTGTIEFRRGAGVTSLDDVFMWTEVAMAFVGAALHHGHLENLQEWYLDGAIVHAAKYPANVGGLERFIADARLGAEHQLRYVDMFTSRAADDAFAEPLPDPHVNGEEREVRLAAAEADAKRHYHSLAFAWPAADPGDGGTNSGIKHNCSIL